MSVGPQDWTGGHEWLRGVESPFSWQLTEVLPAPERAGMVLHLKQREHTLAREHRKVFTFNNFIVRLLLGYEMHLAGENSTAAILQLDGLEQELNRLDITSNNSFYREVRRAQWHVALATRAVLLAQMERLEESRKVVEPNFDHVSSLTSAEVAGLHGIKSACSLEYGKKGGDKALHWAKQAVQTNPNQPEWHLLAGKSMEILRRNSDDFSGIPKEELSYFEKAVSLSPLPTYGLYLAGVHDDIIQAIFSNNARDKNFKTSFLYKEISNISRHTVQLYQKILRNDPNCTTTQVRCLEGMLKLPRQFLNEDQLKSLVLRLTNLPKKTKKFYNVAATYYLKIEKDHRTALRFFEEGAIKGDYACSINEIRLRFKLRHDIDAEMALLKLVKQFKNDPISHEGVLAHLAAFYLFQNNDLTAALDIFSQILAVNPSSKALLVHKPIFVRSVRPMNLLLVMVNQVRVADVLPLVVPASPRTRAMFLRVINRHHPELLAREVDVTMMDRIRDASARLDPAHRRRIKKRQHDKAYV